MTVFAPGEAPLVSVIMPVFNAGAYLRDSVSSALGQTYRQIELICFNDASTDGSLGVLDTFAASDRRVVIIDSDINVRQGGGRNRALRMARGRYVMFLDADDALRSDAVEVCVDTACRYGADMVVFDYTRHAPSLRSSYTTDVCQLGEDASMMRGDTLRRRIIERTTPVWSAMYERRLIVDNGLFFPEKVFYEDNAVALAIQLSADNPVKINHPLYLYRIDNPSVTRSVNNYRFFDRLASAVTLLGHLRRLGIYSRFPDEIDFLFLNQYYIHTIFGCIYRFDKVPLRRLGYVKATVERYVPDFRNNQFYRAQSAAMKLKIMTHARFPRTIKMLSNLKRTLSRFRRCSIRPTMS